MKSRRRKWFFATAAVSAAALGILIQFALGGSTWAIGTGKVPRPNDVHVEPVPDGPAQQVANGTNFGVDWVLYAYDSNRGLCLQLEYSDPDGAPVAAGGCGYGVPTQRRVGYNATRIDWGPGTLVAGPVALEVARVEVRVKGGGTISTPTFEGPKELTQRSRFYVAAVPGGAEVASLIGYDAEGAILERGKP